eukprot:SAG31_NODE_20186_length_581_cov_1.186722_2_plen_60_part_01
MHLLHQHNPPWAPFDLSFFFKKKKTPINFVDKISIITVLRTSFVCGRSEDTVYSIYCRRT